MNEAYSSTDVLENLLEEWRNISQQELANHVQSMTMRGTVGLKAADAHKRFLILTPPWFQDTLFHLCLLNVCETCSVYVSR